MCNIQNYDYYYHRLRKFSLLRYYENQGYDTRKIYDSTITDSKLIEKEQLKFCCSELYDLYDRMIKKND